MTESLTPDNILIGEESTKFEIYRGIENNFRFKLPREEDYELLFDQVLLNSSNKFIERKRLERLLTMFNIDTFLSYLLKHSFFTINVDKYKQQLHNRFRSTNCKLIIAYLLKKLTSKTIMRIVRRKDPIKSILESTTTVIKYETIYILFFIILFGQMTNETRTKLFFRLIDSSSKSSGSANSSVSLIQTLTKYTKFVLLFSDCSFNEMLCEEGYSEMFDHFLQNKDQAFYIFFKIHVLQMRCSKGKERDFAVYLSHKYLFHDRMTKQSINIESFQANLKGNNYDFFDLDTLRDCFLNFWTVYMKKKNDIFLIELNNMLKYYYECFVLKQPGSRSSLESEVFKLDLVDTLKSCENIIGNENMYDFLKEESNFDKKYSNEKIAGLIKTKKNFQRQNKAKPQMEVSIDFSDPNLEEVKEEDISQKSSFNNLDEFEESKGNVFSSLRKNKKSSFAEKSMSEMLIEKKLYKDLDDEPDSILKDSKQIESIKGEKKELFSSFQEDKSFSEKDEEYSLGKAAFIKPDKRFERGNYDSSVESEEKDNSLEIDDKVAIGESPEKTPESSPDRTPDQSSHNSPIDDKDNYLTLKFVMKQGDKSREELESNKKPSRMRVRSTRSLIIDGRNASKHNSLIRSTTGPRRMGLNTTHKKSSVGSSFLEEEVQENKEENIFQGNQDNFSEIAKIDQSNLKRENPDVTELRINEQLTTIHQQNEFPCVLEELPLNTYLIEPFNYVNMLNLKNEELCEYYIQKLKNQSVKPELDNDWLIRRIIRKMREVDFRDGELEQDKNFVDLVCLSNLYLSVHRCSTKENKKKIMIMPCSFYESLEKLFLDSSYVDSFKEKFATQGLLSQNDEVVVPIFIQDVLALAIFCPSIRKIKFFENMDMIDNDSMETNVAENYMKIFKQAFSKLEDKELNIDEWESMAFIDYIGKNWYLLSIISHISKGNNVLEMNNDADDSVIARQASEDVLLQVLLVLSNFME